MSYDISIVRPPSERACHILARRLAEDPEISLQRALLLLQNTPLVYARGLTKAQLAHEIANLQKIGVQIRVSESGGEEKKSAPDSIPNAEKSVGAHAQQHAPLPRETAVKPAAMRSQRSSPPIRAGKLPEVSSGAPRSSRARSVAYSAGAVAVVVLLIAVFLYLADRRPRYAIRPTDAFSSKSSAHQTNDSRQGRRHSSARTRSAAVPGREPVSARRKTMAENLVDSARSGTTDYDRMIKFYTMALSFNEYNLAAWYGLISAYRDAGKPAEAARAEAEMKDLFGEEIESVRHAVSPFGELLDVAGPVKGTLRLEYAARSRSRDRLVQDTYAIMRALRVHCACSAVSLYARTGAGAGMLVYLPLTPFPQTASAYEREAQITLIE